MNVKIIFIFHIRNLGGTADINSSQWGEVVCAVFFVTIQSQWRASLYEQRTGKPVLQVSIADAILRMRL